MANPPIFQPGFNYSNWQATNPVKPLPAQQVDNDFANAARSINQAISAIGDVRRSDGKLKNGIVGPDALAPQFSIGFSFEGNWAADQQYQAGDGVVFSQVFYAARVSHTSSVANQPPDSGTWTPLFSLDDIVVAGALSMPVATFLSDGVTTDFNLGFAPISNRNVFVTIGGQIQDPSEYSINGNTLTFVTAPPTGPLGEAYTITARGFATTATLVTPADGSVTPVKLASSTTALFATAAQGAKADAAMQPTVYDPRSVAGDPFAYNDKAQAIAATISANLTTIQVSGFGPYTSVNNGSTDTFTSNAGARTWYRVKDILKDRLSLEAVEFLRGKFSAPPNLYPRRDVQSGYIRYDFKTGASNFQNHAFDPVNRHLYTLQHNNSTDGPGQVKRFDMDVFDTSVAPTQIDAQSDSTLIGHQALEVETLTSGAVKLWTQLGPTSLGRSMIRFDYTAGGAPANVETYNLFDPAIMANATISASISPDGQWLALRGLGNSSAGVFASKDVIAVFSLPELVAAGPGDRWSLARFFWSYEPYLISSVKQSLQACPIDGKFIHLVFGPGALSSPNKIITYTLDGNLVEDSGELVLGKTDAAALNSATGDFNEMEGAKFVRFAPDEAPVLTIGFVQGTVSGTYWKRIYVAGSVHPGRRGYVTATKGGTAQTLTANSTVKVAWTTIKAQAAVDFDTTNSAVIPRKGQKLKLRFKTAFTGQTNVGQVTASLYKNGTATNTTGQINTAGDRYYLDTEFTTDIGNGTDAYDVRVVSTIGGTLSGSENVTRFEITAAS